MSRRCCGHRPVRGGVGASPQSLRGACDLCPLVPRGEPGSASGFRVEAVGPRKAGWMAVQGRVPSVWGCGSRGVARTHCGWHSPFFNFSLSSVSGLVAMTSKRVLRILLRSLA